MKIYNESLDEAIIAGVLQNGLNYYIIPKCAYVEKRALLTVAYGAVDSSFISGGKTFETPLGCAHFLEHKLFDSERGSAFDSFSRLGAYVNAYTSFNNTAYYFSCEDNFFECLKTLLGFVSEPYFTESSVLKEAPIIEREISMYDDNPGWASYFELLSNIYQRHPAKNSIAGTKESISQITAETLYLCHKSFYVPSNMHLICAGGFSQEEIDKITETAEKYMQDGGKRAETIIPLEAENVKTSRSFRKMNVSRPLFQIGFKDKGLLESSEPALRQCAVKTALDMLIGESSTLKEELVNKRLIDDAPSFDYVCGNGYGYTVLSGESREPEAFLAHCEREFVKMAEKGFETSCFQRIKKKHLGRFARGFNSVESVTMAAAENAVKGISLFDYYDNYKKTEIEDCNGVLRSLFRSGGVSMSVIGS